MDNPYPICENCIFVDEPLDKDPCQECNRAFLAQRIKPNFVRKRKPITNADRIRSMTDEELAEFAVSTGQGCSPGKDFVKCCFDDKDLPVEADCRKCWLDWLKEEAE